MKKILAVILAVLMVLPAFASFAFANETAVVDDDKGENVASEATIEVLGVNGSNPSVDKNVHLDALVDGDKSTGTHSPQGNAYRYMLNYSEAHYFTDIVVACNGKGKLANGMSVSSNKFNIQQIRIAVYYGDDITYQSEILDVSSLTEITVSANVKGDKVEVYKVTGSGGRTEYMWEIETYAPNIEVCSAQVENIASQAVFSATGGNANYWWAMDYKSWVDGNPLTGSHSPKGRNYSVWMHFPEEHLFSQIDIVCNTDGGATLSSGAKLEDRYIGNSMMQVRVYNYNEDLVWDSDQMDTSTITQFSIAPYVEGAIIEICFFNGNFGGGEYMYEVAAYSQSGDHVFEKTAEENPTCLLPGIQELTCQCGKVIKQKVDPTGFHKWSEEGVVSKGASATENGVMTYSCLGCDLVKNRDIPSTGHNWDNGTVVPPACDKEGYTLYKCTDPDCKLEYKADYVDGYVHQWDDGKVTSKPTVDAEGVITYSCLNPGCNEKKYGRIRKHKYTDNTTSLSSSLHIKNITHVQTKQNDSPVVDPKNVFDGQMDTWWFGDAGSYVWAELKQEYIFTSGFFYGSSNWSSVTIQFLVDNPNFKSNQAESDANPRYIVTCEFGSGNIDNGCDTSAPKEHDMLDALSGGTRAKYIKLITNNPKVFWADQYPGSGCKLQELKLTMHDCKVSAEDYILSGNEYVAPKCGVDGKCAAICQVCGIKHIVTLEASADFGHNYGTITTDTAPTCTQTGVGHAQCTECKQTIQGITIPATGNHSFTTDNILVTAKCGFAGVGQKCCEYCGTVGSIYEIAPTGIHDRAWKLQSNASYTAVGKEVYACIYCDDVSDNDPELGINTKISDKFDIPNDLITFVGSTKGTDGNKNTLTFTFKINLEHLPEIEQTCDVRIITLITDSEQRQATIESYGKYATNEYNAETGEFTITIYPSSENATFEVVTYARLMNFRGIVTKNYSSGTYSMSNAQ